MLVANILVFILMRAFFQLTDDTGFHQPYLTAFLHLFKLSNVLRWSKLSVIGKEAIDNSWGESRTRHAWNMRLDNVENVSLGERFLLIELGSSWWCGRHNQVQ